MRPAEEVRVDRRLSLTKEDILAMDNWDNIPGKVLEEVINDARYLVLV